MGSYSDFKKVIDKFDIDVVMFCNSSGIAIDDIKEAESSGVLPSYIELSLIRYVEYLKEDSIFTRACKSGLKIRDGKIIINLFDYIPNSLDGLTISDNEKQFVFFTDNK